MDFLFGAAFMLLPWTALAIAVLHGPIKTPLWRGETPLGFALAIGIVAFAVGFFCPMALAPSANQGPMLGIFITGPLGFAGGLVWGIVRARLRRSRIAAPASH